MSLIYEKGIYLFEEFLDFGVIAGFNDKAFLGLNVEEDIKNISLSLNFSYKNLAYLRQVHSNIVVEPKEDSCLFRGDSLITDEKDRVLIVKTADCLPLFFYDSKNKVIGIIHLGWKPAKEGILDGFTKKLAGWKGLNLKDCFLGLGPALRKCCFEVGKEFLNFPCFNPSQKSLIFRSRDECNFSLLARKPHPLGSGGSTSFIEKRKSKLFLDIVKFAQSYFINKGLDKKNFLDSGICSKCSEKFYSFRRDKTQSRTISFILQK